MRFTVKKTLEMAKAQGAEVLVQVKGNQPGLLAAVESLMDTSPIDSLREATRGHGRGEERTVHVFAPAKDLLPPEWDAWIASIICVHRRTLTKAKKNRLRMREETSWYICTTRLSASEAALAIRGHWGIEAHHYVRDVTFREDECRIRDQPTIFARIRTMAFNILRHNQVQHMSEAIFRYAISFELLLNLRGI